MAIALFGLDLALPLGTAGGIPYLALALLGWWAREPRAAVLLAAAAAALTVAGPLASSAGGDLWTVLVERGPALLAIAATAAVLFLAKRRERALAEDRAARQARIEAQAAEIAAAKTHVELANWSRSEFLSDMSHELRTPLNAIIGFSEIVKREMFGPLGSAQYRDYVKDINASGQRLLEIVNDLLEIAKIEAGEVALEERALDVSRLVRSCLSEMAVRAEAGGVRLESRVPAALPELRADERKLKQMLGNLLSNAVKFTPPGGRVTVTAWSRPDAGTVVQVADSGIGIALDDVPVALAPFGQVASGLQRGADGTGLGLPLTKALIELHAGSFDLQSEPGAGTTVTLRFPAERVVAVPKVA
ncbi:MAG: sensor histidine kinase [Kiloniellaceae bacterium]